MVRHNMVDSRSGQRRDSQIHKKLKKKKFISKFQKIIQKNSQPLLSNPILPDVYEVYEALIKYFKQMI